MTEVAAPAPTGAPTAPAEGIAAPAPAPDPGAPQNAIQAIFAKRQAKEEAAAKAAEAAPPGDKPADAPPGDKPEPSKEPPAEDKGLSLKHAQLKADHRKALADHEKLKADHAAMAKERDELKSMFGPGKNHLKALEKAVGKPFKQIMEDAARGAYDERNALPPEQQAKLDAFEAWKAQQEAQAAEQKAAAARAEDEGVAAEFMQVNAEKYPLFAASGLAAGEMVERAYADLKANRQPDFEAIAQECENLAAVNLEKFFGNAPLMGALAKRPAVRQLWLKALGLSEHTAPRPASGTSGESGTGNGPRTLSHTTTQESPVPPPPGDEPEEDWLSGAKARLNQYKQHGRIGR